MRYNNYHKHTHKSNKMTLDCVSKPIDYILRAKELGHTTYFTTEHGWMGDIFEAHTLCQKHELECIYGVEAYYVDDMYDKTSRTNYHIILIAMTENARREINKIISKANIDGYYYKPRIDLNCLLSLTPDETIITTACVGGRMFKEGYEEKFLIPVLKHFKNNFYLETQCHNDDYQARYNKMILECSLKYNIQIIHANDSHYIKPEDSKYRDLFLKAKGIIYEDEGGFVLDYPTYNEIVERYEKQGVLNHTQIKQALDNTLVFDNSEGIHLDKDFKIPKVTEGDSDEHLKNILQEAWKVKGKKVKPNKRKKYIQGIKDEFKAIKDCGMSDYFILDHLIVKRAVEEYGAILTRSGRGSGVSFYINNLLGLTEVDRFKAPITLYPSRFMTTERILSSRSLPDIDLNFADTKPVVKASKDILGEDGIYYMIAYKPLQESSAFRLWCKANDMHINDYNDIAKNLEEYVDDKYWGRFIEESKVFRGVIESIAPSPCSFLLSNKNISSEIGLIKVGDEICCCLDGYNCDEYKYLKNDYLTVQVYSLISEVYRIIGKPIDDIGTLVNNCDDKVWAIYADGITTTINQADSDFGKQILKKYKPTNLAELSAFVAAIRPGFASMLDNFVERKEYSTGVLALDDLLEDSFRYMMYQESIMKYLVWLGLPEKNTFDVIKKISKKKFEEKELIELKATLLKGWIKQVGKEGGFEETWQVVEDAVRYSFNASHSLSVAIDSLYGAYLKANHPLIYMTVALNLYKDDAKRTTNLIDELKYFNITMKSPKFGFSKEDYFFNREDNVIYKGISSIKFLNVNVANELYDLANENKYTNFIDLLIDITTNTSANSRQIKILIGLNFFEVFGNNKKLLDMFELFILLNGKKQVKCDKIDKLGIYIDILEKFTSKRTEKIYKDIDLISYMKEHFERLENKQLSAKEQMEFEMTYLEYITYINEKAGDNFYAVIEVKTYQDKSKPYVVLRQINSGFEFKSKVTSKKIFQEHPFELFNILKVNTFREQYKKKKIGDEWVNTSDLEKILIDWEVY